MRKKLVCFRFSEKTLKMLDSLSKANSWNKTECLEKIILNIPQLIEEVESLKKENKELQKRIQKLLEENQKLLKELRKPWWKKILL